MTDPVERNDELEQKIAAMPVDSFYTKRSVSLAFSLLVGLLLIVLGGMLSIALSIRDTTAATNNAVTGDIGRLEAKVAEQEDIIGQLTDAVILLSNTLIENGIDPPEIVIRPQTEE